MLDVLRRNRKKFVGIMVAVFCALLMVGFGVGSSARGSRQKPVATVNGIDISYRQYSTQYERIASRFREQLGKNFGMFQDQLNLKQQTLDFLVNDEVLNDYIRRAGLAAGIRQVEERIQKYPYFSGGMTKAAYDSFLRATGMTGAQLEKLTEEEVVREQLNKLFGDLATPTADELKAVYLADNTAVKLHYMTIKSSDFTNKVDLTDAEKLKAYFEKNGERYRTAKQVNFVAVQLTPTMYANKVELTDEDLQSYYDQHQLEFTDPKQVQLRRILIKTDKTDEEKALPFLDKSKAKENQSDAGSKEAKRARAEEVVKKLNDGVKFADLAAEYSEDTATKNNGGDLGMQTYENLEPELRPEAVKLLLGEHSGVLDTKQGLQIIYVENIIDRKTRPLADVRKDVEEKIRTSEAPLYASVDAEAIISEISTADGSLEKYVTEKGQEKNLKLISTGGFVSLTQASKDLPLPLVTKALEMSAGDRKAVPVGSTYYVVEVRELKEPAIPSLDEVRDAVVKDYTEEQSHELARNYATDILSQLKAKLDESKAEDLMKRSGALMEALAKEQKLEVKTSEGATKASAATLPFNIPAIRSAAFQLTPPNPLHPEVAEMAGAYYLVSLADRTAPPAADFEKKRAELERSESQKASNRLFETMLASLKAESDIWINPEFLSQLD